MCDECLEEFDNENQLRMVSTQYQTFSSFFLDAKTS